MRNRNAILASLIFSFFLVSTASTSHAQRRGCRIVQKRICRPLLQRLRCRRQVVCPIYSEPVTDYPKFCVTSRNKIIMIGGSAEMCFLTGLHCTSDEVANEAGMPSSSCTGDICTASDLEHCSQCSQGCDPVQDLTRSGYRVWDEGSVTDGEVAHLLVTQSLIRDGLADKVDPAPDSNTWITTVNVRGRDRYVAFVKYDTESEFHLIGLEVEAQDVTEGIEVDDAATSPLFGSNYVYVTMVESTNTDEIRKCAIFLSRR